MGQVITTAKQKWFLEYLPIFPRSLFAKKKVHTEIFVKRSLTDSLSKGPTVGSR